MAQSRSGKGSGKSSQKSSSRSSSSAKRRSATQSKASGQKKSPSRSAANRARRRQERNSVMGSIPLAAVGILAIALVIVPGQSAWSVVRSWMFGVFGIVTYLVGPLLLYLAYLIASGYLVGKFLAKTLLLALVWRSHRCYSGGALRAPGSQLCYALAVCHRTDGVLCRHAAGCGAVYCLSGRTAERGTCIFL